MITTKFTKELADLAMVLETVTRGTPLHIHAQNVHSGCKQIADDFVRYNPYEELKSLKEVNRELAFNCAGLRAQVKSEKRKVVEL